MYLIRAIGASNSELEYFAESIQEMECIVKRMIKFCAQEINVYIEPVGGDVEMEITDEGIYFSDPEDEEETEEWPLFLVIKSIH